MWICVAHVREDYVVLHKRAYVGHLQHQHYPLRDPRQRPQLSGYHPQTLLLMQAEPVVIVNIGLHSKISATCVVPRVRGRGSDRAPSRARALGPNLITNRAMGGAILARTVSVCVCSVHRPH